MSDVPAQPPTEPERRLPFRLLGEAVFEPEIPLPQIDQGAMYWSDATLLHHVDPGQDLLDRKSSRPVVVVRPPSSKYPKVTVVVRTTDTRRNGVPHPAVPQLGLDQAGVFLPGPRWAHAEKFREPSVEFIGQLDVPYIVQVLAMVGDKA